MTLSNSIKNIHRDKSKFSLNGYSVVEVSGSDVSNFLSGQLTSKVKDLSEKTFQKSALTCIKGKVISEFFVLKESSSTYYIVVEEQLLESTLSRLDLYLISEDVSFKKIDKLIYLYFNLRDEGYRGEAFNLKLNISFKNLEQIKNISEKEFHLLRFYSGETKLSVHAQVGDLITNTFLTESSVSFNKGCYPGQETISKIYNNRGAANYPICLIGSVELPIEDVTLNGKKIGEIKEVVCVGDTFYHYALINRENRIESKKLELNKNLYTTKFFPLTNNSPEVIAQEIYDEAVSLFHEDKDEESIVQLNKAIEINPSFADAYESLGVIYGRIKEFEKAIEVMKKLSDVDPSSVMAHTNMSMYYMQLGDKETAEEHKSTATIKQFEMFGKEAENKRNKESLEKEQQAEKSRKEGMFKQVLEIDADDSLANYGMGEIELERKNFHDSIQYLEKSIKFDKKYSVAYLTLSKALIASEQIEKAIEVLNTGISVATKNGDLMPANEMQAMINKL